MKEINFNYYEENASEFFESTVTADMVDLYTSFLSMVSPGGRILDLGCGSGRDSKYFIRQGFQVEAMDGSPALCRLASEFIGQEVFCAQIEDGLSAGVRWNLGLRFSDPCREERDAGRAGEGQTGSEKKRSPVCIL